MILYDGEIVYLDTIIKAVTTVGIIHVISSDDTPVAWYSEHIAETTEMYSATVHVIGRAVILDDGIDESYVIPIAFTGKDSRGKYAKLRGVN